MSRIARITFKVFSGFTVVLLAFVLCMGCFDAAADDDEAQIKVRNRSGTNDLVVQIGSSTFRSLDGDSYISNGTNSQTLTISEGSYYIKCKFGSSGTWSTSTTQFSFTGGKKYYITFDSETHFTKTETSVL